MRYTEKDLKTKYDSFTDYIKSIVELLLLAPFRLVNEISKKVVFLEKKRLEILFIVAIGIAIFVIVIESILEFSFGTLNLFLGEFAILFRVIAVVILIVLYGFIKNYNFSVHSQLSFLNDMDEQSEEESEKDNEKKRRFYDVDQNPFNQENDDLNDFDVNKPGEFDGPKYFNENEYISNDEPVRDTTFENEDKSSKNEQKNTEDIDQIKNEFGVSNEIKTEEIKTEEIKAEDGLDNYDCGSFNVIEMINDDVYESMPVINYRNKHSETVSYLQKYDKQPNKLFTESELISIQEMCNKAVNDSAYISEDVINIAFSDKNYDNFSSVEEFLTKDNVDWSQSL